MLENTEATPKNFFTIIPMGTLGYGCPIRFVPTYILHAIEIRQLWKV